MSDEIVLEVGAEGGSLAVFGERIAEGKWRFRVVRDEISFRELLSDEDLEGLVLFELGDYVPSFQDALKLLDRYPWFRLYPLVVHPNFLDLVLSGVKKRGGTEEETRWREMLKRRSHS
jgi:hypothetical protein